MSSRVLLGCLAAVVVAAATGCGLGAGEERSGAGVELRVTRDYGHELLSATGPKRIREDETVMRLLRSDNEVETRFGGGFVQEIDGLEGGGPSGSSDWFFYVNGIEADKGAADYELSPGDVVQWDFHSWDSGTEVRAIVGAFPQPLLDGLGSKRFPVRVECEDAESEPCVNVKRHLRSIGVPASGASLGAPGNQRVVRVVVADWGKAREMPSARIVEQGPEASGVFARFADRGATLELLDSEGQVVRRLGAGAGLIAAVRLTDDELVWLVTGVDDSGVARAADALRRRDLRDAFAVAIGPEGPEKLPLEPGE